MPDTVRSASDMLAQPTTQLTTGGGNTAEEVRQLMRDMLLSMAPMPISDIDATQWIMPGWGWGSGQTPTITSGRLAYTPIYCARPMSVDRIGVEVVVGAVGSIRLGIYNAVHNQSQHRISLGTLLVDAGTVDVGTSGSKTLTISQTLHGFYYLASVGDSAPICQTPDPINGAVISPVQWMNNDLNGTFDHCIPLVLSQSALVAGGLPSTPVAPTLTGTVGVSCVRLRLT